MTLSETRETMQPRRSDKRWVRLAKQWFRFLIVSAEECLKLADLGDPDVADVGDT